jgi:hypothetical protein
MGMMTPTLILDINDWKTMGSKDIVLSRYAIPMMVEVGIFDTLIGV